MPLKETLGRPRFSCPPRGAGWAESGPGGAQSEQWNAPAVQQLARYEALVQLFEEIQLVVDLEQIARRVATQWMRPQSPPLKLRSYQALITPTPLPFGPVIT